MSRTAHSAAPICGSSTGPIAVGLVVLIVLAFSRIGRNDFVSYDDGFYVFANPKVLAGLTWSGVAWAFSTTLGANWHPLTWISHMIDVELFGLAPAGHHWVSVLLHALSAVLLFLVLRSMTGARWRSAIVAALFAVHPLRVESVAWVAERKDVLSVFFGVLTLAAHVRYVREPGARRYLAVVATFVFGLLSKPMLVTLPFVLLLLDFWPLGRIEFPRGAVPWPRVRELVLEKLPLIVLSAASCVVTFWIQSAGGATASLQFFPFRERVANAIVAYAVYLWMTICPVSLAVFYPHASSLHEQIPAWQIAAAAGLLLALSAIALRQSRRRPFLIVGWLWYLGTLLPVIGVIQVGSQAMADRYTYLPSIGPWIAATWGGSELFDRWRWHGRVRAAVVSALLGILAVSTWIQVGVWRDSTSLYTNALAVTRKNWLAWNNLGIEQLVRGDLPAALASFRTAIAIRPDYGRAWFNVGVVMTQRNDVRQALGFYQEALRLEPGNVDYQVNLGAALMDLGRYSDAIDAFDAALLARPEDPLILSDLALVYSARGDRARALDYHRRLQSVDPSKADELVQQIGPAR